MNKKEGTRSSIWWVDAVLWSKKEVPSGLTKMLTTGAVIREKGGFVLVKNPLTYVYDNKLKEYVPKAYKEDPTFFLIPLTSITRRTG